MYLTKKQKEIFEYLKDHLDALGYAPTFEEIAHHFNFSSKGTVYKYIRILQEKGFISHEWNKSRAIEISSETTESFESLPVKGLVSAGRPIQAVEDNEQFAVPKSFIRLGQHYVLKVTGESMIEEHIVDGDYIVVREVENVENGQTVVALLDNENATIKRIYKKNEQVELRPANKAFKSIFIDANKVIIQGVVVGVLRKY